MKLGAKMRHTDMHMQLPVTTNPWLLRNALVSVESFVVWPRSHYTSQSMFMRLVMEL